MRGKKQFLAYFQDIFIALSTQIDSETALGENFRTEYNASSNTFFNRMYLFGYQTITIYFPSFQITHIHSKKAVINGRLLSVIKVFGGRQKSL